MSYAVKLRATRSSGEEKEYQMELELNEELHLDRKHFDLPTLGSERQDSICTLICHEGWIELVNRAQSEMLTVNFQTGDTFLLRAFDVLRVPELEVEFLVVPSPVKDTNQTQIFSRSDLLKEEKGTQMLVPDAPSLPPKLPPKLTSKFPTQTPQILSNEVSDVPQETTDPGRQHLEPKNEESFETSEDLRTDPDMGTDHSNKRFSRIKRKYIYILGAGVASVLLLWLGLSINEANEIEKASSAVESEPPLAPPVSLSTKPIPTLDMPALVPQPINSVAKKVQSKEVDVFAQEELWTASSEGNLEVVKNLIRQKVVDINSQDKNGTTPLMWAAFKGRKSVVQYLKNQGADVSLHRKDGDTALSLAKKWKRLEVVKVLSPHESRSLASVHPSRQLIPRMTNSRPIPRNRFMPQPNRR